MFVFQEAAPLRIFALLLRCKLGLIFRAFIHGKKYQSDLGSEGDYSALERRRGGKKGRSETKQRNFVYSLNYLRPCAHQRMEIYIGGARRHPGTKKVRAKDESLLLQTLTLLGFFLPPLKKYSGFVFACCGSKSFHDVKVPKKTD